MKKTTFVSVASFVFLLTASTVEYFTRSLLTDAVSTLVRGVIILLISGIIALIARERRVPNIICFFISAVAMGILLRAWYINRGFANSYLVMLLVSLASALYISVFFFISKLPFVNGSKRAYTALCVIYAIASVAGYIVVVFTTETTYVSTFGYYMIIELAFIFAMSLEVDNMDGLIRNLTLSTYSVFVVAIIVAIFVIIAAAGGGDCDCDCGGMDCGDCCDCGDPGLDFSSSKKKKKDVR
jgi:hypothetical protein